jgi:hypothetical protein
MKESERKLGYIYLKGIRKMLARNILKADLPEWIANRKLRHGVTQ